MYRQAAGAVAVAAVLALASPIGTEAAGAGSCWSWTANEKKLARLTNRARTQRDKPKLRLDPELSKVAKVHTKLMAASGVLQHSDSQTLAHRVTNWSVLAENVGYGPAVRDVHRAFMKSTAHKANVLNRRFRHVGIGIRRSGDTLWITALFSGKENPGTRLNMPC